MSCTLAVDGDRLVWISRKIKSGVITEEGSIPLCSIDAMEFVVPKQSRLNARRLRMPAGELFIIDANKERHQLPRELWVFEKREKIIAAMKKEKPDIRVSEKIQ